MTSIALKRIADAAYDDELKCALFGIRDAVVQETVAMNPAFDFSGLEEEVEQALVDLSYYGERHREHLTRYARSRANRFVYVRASGWHA